MNTERLDRLNARFKGTTPTIDLERARLVTKAYEKYANNVPIMLRAKAFAYILDNMEPSIKEDDLFAASQTQKTRGVPIFPEFGAKWIIKELPGLPTRETDPINISDEDSKELVEILEKWGDNTFDVQCDSLLSPYALKAQECGALSISARLTGMGHYSPDYPTILKTGLKGVMDRCREMIEKTQIHTPEDLKKIDFWKATILSCEAVIRFAHKHAELALKLAEETDDPKRKAELKKMADICCNVPENEPRDFWEALQFVWFIHLTVQIEDNGHGMAVARMDQNLYEYYKGSVLDGDMSSDEADELIAAFYLKVNEMIKIRDSWDSRAFAAYPMWQQLAVGGYTRDGKDASNELSYALMRAWSLVKTVSPTMTLHVTEDTPDDLMEMCLKYVQKGYAIPAFYNSKLIGHLLRNKGATLEDSRDYTIHGCVEPFVQGKSDGRPLVGYVNAAKCIELVLNNGWDPVAKCEMGLKTGDPAEFKSMKEFEAAFHKQMTHFVGIMCEEFTKVCACHAEYIPKAFGSALVQDCIGRGRSLEEGGAIYNSSGVFLVAMANGADSLEAIDYVVYKEKLMGMHEFNDVLLHNFEGNERLRQIILNKIPKYGNDKPEVDSYANRMIRAYNEEMYKYRDSRGAKYENCILSQSYNVLQGLKIGATPDGRLAGEPVADNASPMVGRDCTSPTATIKSLASIDQTDINNGTLFNIKFSPTVIQGEQGLQILKNCILSYFHMNGEHIQINVVSEETLRDAQKNPQDYKDLLVRVAGYSAYFIELDKAVQENIIERTAHENVGCGC